MSDSERPITNQNWQGREFINFGPHFRVDTGNPQMGYNGSVVYDILGYGGDSYTSSIGMNYGGIFHIENDGSIEITGGTKEEGGCNIVITGMTGDVNITAMGNGQIKLTAKNLVIDADEDIVLDAGKNIRLNAGNEIRLESNIANCDALTGNLAPRDVTFGGWCFDGTEIGGPELAASFTGGKFKEVASEMKGMAESIDTGALKSGIKDAASGLSDAMSNFGGF